LNGNKKERALRDSFGEWVEEAKTEKDLKAYTEA